MKHKKIDFALIRDYYNVFYNEVENLAICGNYTLSERKNQIEEYVYLKLGFRTKMVFKRQGAQKSAEIVDYISDQKKIPLHEGMRHAQADKNILDNSSQPRQKSSCTVDIIEVLCTIQKSAGNLTTNFRKTKIIPISNQVA
ncbi:hypothetical protein EDEG_03886 [Edhazardia aedis USNM 41457]|uniref:Uncharacterized protein n=1 Tax=Edhazardia aedis (strain USNM 41457) TaxID=1003232 RepID=J9DJN0_EDHAE|nr:hypothetical protein EDEG_03886 [Edhazardia aedis USNM 41457]|eukprot:EJW01547.1 hypothetical protein EDEG_03886 [Edhazardia aedis USNM 41457]